MENLDLGLNLGFVSEENLDKLLETLTLLENGINSLNATDDTSNVFYIMLKNAISLKQELEDIKEIYKNINDTTNKSNNTSSNTKDKNDLKSTVIDLTQQIKNLIEIYKNTQTGKGKNNSNNNNNNGTKPHNNNNTELDRINNELRANAKAYNKDYSNKRNLNTTDYFRKLTDENVRALKDTMKMFEGLTKESINKLSDNNFNSILTNGITKRLQEFSKESKNEYDFTKTVNEFFKNIADKIGDNNFVNFSKVKTSMNKGKVESIKNEISNIENKYVGYGMEKTDLTLINSLNDLRKVVEDKRKQEELFDRNKHKDYKPSKELDDLYKKFNRNKKLGKDSYFDEKIDYEMTYDIYKEQKKQNSLNKEEYLNKLRTNTSTIFFTKEILNYLGNMVGFNGAKEFEKNVTSLGVSGNIDYRGAVDNQKTKLLSKTGTTGIDTNEYAMNLREVIKTGRDYEQSIKIVDTASQLATTSFENLTTAVTILNGKFLALDMDMSNDRIDRVKNRIYNILDNTALDLQDIANAGKQTNPILNSMVDSAENKGNLKNQSIEDYKEQLISIEQSFIGELRQQGKTGEQAGTVIRNLFTKLMDIDGVSAKMLDKDLSKVNKETLEKVGFSNAKELSDLWQSGDIKKALNGLSMLVSQGEISFTSLKKMVTERHSSSVVSVFNKINGDLDSFIDKMSKGKDLTDKQKQALDNWASSLDRIKNNLANIGKNFFTTGIIGAGLKGTGKIVDETTKRASNLINSDNIITSSLTTGVTQAIALGTVYNTIKGHIQDKAIKNVNSSFNRLINPMENMKNRYKNNESIQFLIDKNISKAYENRELLIQDIQSKSNLKSFVTSTRLASSSVSDLTNRMVNLGKTGTSSLKTLGFSISEVFASVSSFLSSNAWLIAIAGTITAITKVYQRIEQVKQMTGEAGKTVDNIKEIENQSKILHENIDNVLKINNKENKINDYKNIIDSYINKNEELNESFKKMKQFRESSFETLNSIIDKKIEELYKKENKESGIESAKNYNLFSNDGSLAFDKSNRDKYKDYHSKDYNENLEYLKKKYFTIGTPLFPLIPFTDFMKNSGNGFLRESGKFIEKYPEFQIKIAESSINFLKGKSFYDYGDRNDVDNYSNKLKSNYDKIYGDLVKETSNFKNVDKKDVDKFVARELINRYDTDLLNDMFKGVNFNKGKKYTTYEKLKKIFETQEDTNKDGSNFDEIASKFTAGEHLTPEKKAEIIKLLEQVELKVKEGEELYLKQLEIYKDSLQRTKDKIKKYDEEISSILSQTKMPQVITQDLLKFEYKKDDKGNQIYIDKETGKSLDYSKMTDEQFDKALGSGRYIEATNTLSKEKLSKLNSEFKSKINSINPIMWENNSEGVQKYSADMSEIYTQRADLMKALEDTEFQKSIFEKEGNQKELEIANKRIEILKENIKQNEEAEKKAKHILELSNFNMTSIQNVAQLYAELGVKQAQFGNMIGKAFGNAGSSMKENYQSLISRRQYFNQFGKMNLDNQLIIANSNKEYKEILKSQGLSDFSQSNLGNISKIRSQLLEATKSGKDKVNGIDVSKLNEVYGIMTSIASEQVKYKQQELEYAQQEKQIKIDIVKYWLEEQKLKTQFVESGEVYTNETKQANLSIIRKMISGDNELYRMNDLQEITNLKLENSNLKMKDQLDYARRQIAVAKENAQRQINAIRRLEGTNSTNSRKSVVNAKNNTISTNNTIIKSANIISTNLNNAFQQLMTAIQSVQTSYDTGDDGGGSLNGGLANAPVFSYTSLPNLKGSGYNAVLPLAQAVSSQLNGKVSANHLMKLFYLESGWKQGDVTGRYRGLGQWSRQEWGYWVKTLGGQKYGLHKSGPDDPRANALMTALMILHNTDKLKKRGHSVVTPEDIHISHLFSSYMYGNYNDNTKLRNITGVTSHMIYANPSVTKRNLNITVGEAKRNVANIYTKAMGGKSSNGGSSKIKSNYVMTGNNNFTTNSGLVFEKKPVGVNPDLVRLLQDTYTIAKQRGITFKVPASGVLRDAAEQNKYFKQGGSKKDGYKNVGRHQKGQALDISITSKGGDKELRKVNDIVQTLARQRGLKITWGGTWKGFNDPYHFQIENGNWDAYKNPSLRTRGSVGSVQPLQLQTIELPKEYIPNMSASIEKLIREITNNEFTKDMIKSQAEEEAATNIALKYKEFFDNSNDHVKSREMFNNWWNEYVLSHSNEDLSVSKDIARGILDREKTLLDTARDTYDKIVSQFIENVKSLTYSFGDLELKVKDVNTEWERNYNFLTRSKLADTLYDFTKSIETNNVKISSLTRQLAKDIRINPNVISLFNYLEDNMGVRFETQEDRYNFMMSNDKLMPIVKFLEENMFDIAKEQFENLGIDKLAFQALSKEEKQNLLNRAATSLKKQGEMNEDIFQKSQNFDNQTVIYKRLTEQVERNNDIHKAEADNFKSFSKSIEDLSIGIKELSDKMFNLESIRNLNTILEEVKLLSKGVDLDSIYGKKQMAFIKTENSKKLLEESRQSVRTLLKASPITISAMEMAGFNKNDLKNIDLTNFKNIQKLIEGISNFTETQNSVAKEIFNKFLDENPQLEKYRNFNIFDKEAQKELKKQILSDDSIDNNKALELTNFLDNIENGFVKFDDIVSALQKLVTTIKDSNIQFIEMFKHFSTKSVDMLSSILFGTDFEWKGLDYKEALNYLFGMLSDDSKYIKKGFKKFFNIPQDDENVIEQDYSNLNRPEALQSKNKVYLGEYDLRTLMLNKLDKFDLSNEKQDNIYLDEKGNISKVYTSNNEFSNSLINMLKSDKINKINLNGIDVLPELEETGKINLYEVETNAEKTKVWLRNVVTNVKKYEKDVIGSLEETVQSINMELTVFNKTSRDKIGEGKLNKIIGFEGISTLNTPNYSSYNNKELRVIDSIEEANNKLKRENEKNLINSSDKISKIVQYNSDEVNKEKNKKNINDLLYMYDRLQKPIGEGNGVSFKTDKDNKLVYKILNQTEKDVENGISNSITIERLPNGISYKVNGKEVYKLLTENLSKRSSKWVNPRKKITTITNSTRLYSVDSNNKRTNLKDFTYKNDNTFRKFFNDKADEIENNLKQKYPSTKTTKKVTETELEPYFNLSNNTFFDDEYKKKHRIKIQYEGNKDKANSLYYTQNTESTNKYVDPSRNYGADNTLFLQNIEDLKTLAGLIDPNKLTSYQRASKGMVSSNTTTNNIKGTVSEGRGKLTTEVDENGTYVNYLLDGKKIGTLGYEHPTTTITTGRGKKKKTKTVTDEKSWQTYYIDETGKKTIYDKHLTSKEETEELIKDMMKTKDEELYKKYGMDNPTPKVETSQSQSSSFSVKYVDMLKRFEAFNEYVNSKEFIDILKDKKIDKETLAKKVNVWKKAYDILGDKNSKFTAVHTIAESTWRPFEESKVAQGYNFGGLTTPTKWGIEGKSNKDKDGRPHAVFKNMETGIAGRLIYGYTEKAYNDLMYKGGNFSKFYEDYYGRYVGHDVKKYIKLLTDIGENAGINFKDDRVPSNKGENPFDVIPIKYSQKGYKDVDEDKIFEDLKKYREQTGDYSKFDINNIKNLQSYTKQYNDSVMTATSILKDLVVDTSKGKYLSASVEVSDYGDPAVKQFAKDTVGIKTDENNVDNRKVITLFQGHEDTGAKSNGYIETDEAIKASEKLKKLLLEIYGEEQLRVDLYRRKGKIGTEFAQYDKNTIGVWGIHFDVQGKKDNRYMFVADPNNAEDKAFVIELDKQTQGKNIYTNSGEAHISKNYQTRKGKSGFFGLGVATEADKIAQEVYGKNIVGGILELGNLNNTEVMKLLNSEKADEYLRPIAIAMGNSVGLIPKEQLQQKQEENQKPVEITENQPTNQKPVQDIQNYGGNFAELVRQRELERQKEKREKKNQERKQIFQKPFAYATTIVTVIDGMMKRELNYKKKSLEVQAKILEMNLQMAETTEERRRIEEQILQNKLASVDNDYKTQSSFLGGMVGGTRGFALQGALGGATQGASIGGITGALIGTGLGFVGGLLGGTNAKIQAEQQKAQLIAQQKLQWLAEDRNKYLKTMASAMSEQAKWTTKIGVNDAISRSVRAVISDTDTLGGTAYETRTVQHKKKKGGGLLGRKKYDTVEAFTQSYNLNDSMFGGKQFNNRVDLEFAYATLAQKLLNISDNYANNDRAYGSIRRVTGGSGRIQDLVGNPYRYVGTGNVYGSGLREYLQRRMVESSRELTSSEFLKYFNGQGTLSNDGLLIDRSRDSELDNVIKNLKERAMNMKTGQEKVDTLALINFYENIKAVLDREGKTTKRLFGSYYGIETEEKKDEKGNITEYRRINESMWSEMYQQVYQNVMNGVKTFDVGSRFIQGTVNAFIQNVGSGRNTIKAITDEFNRLADQIYDVVTRTGEFTNVNGTIKSLIDNTFTLRQQQKETEKFTVDLAKRWVALGGNITDVIKDMNNGLTTSMESIKSTMLGGSMEETINNFGNNLWQKLGESMTTNLINKKYAQDIFRMNGLLSNASESNSISDIVSLANGYKGLSSRIESDRERLSAIQRLFTANRDIDYVDESIQYETGTSQSVTNNYTFTTDINAGTIVADDLSKELLAQSLFAPLVQMLKDSGFIH